jgi:flagellar motor switch protein FliG
MENVDMAKLGADIVCRLSLRDQVALARAASRGEPLPRPLIDEIKAIRGGADLLGLNDAAIGAERFASIAERLDSYTKARLESELNAEDPAAAAALRGAVFSFDELEHVHIDAMRLVLDSCDQHDIFYALKGASPMIRGKVFSALGAESAMKLKIRLDTAGPVEFSAVEQAQQAISAIATELYKRGAIAKD